MYVFKNKRLLQDMGQFIHRKLFLIIFVLRLVRQNYVKTRTNKQKKYINDHRQFDPIAPNRADGQFGSQMKKENDLFKISYFP